LRASAGGSLGDPVDVTVFVSDIGEYTAATAEVRGDYFGQEGLPTSALVQVAGFLLPEVRVLIKGVVVVTLAR
jgi:enamine deaminase RidA (YjgF/YER057c/UK114 family)